MQLKYKIIHDGNICFKYRGQIPIIILLLAIPIMWSNTHYKAYTTELKCIIQCVGVIVSIAGLILRYYTIGTTPKNTSGRNRNQQIAETLNTTGSYSITRNPLYFANWIIWFGLSLFSFSYVFMIIAMLLFKIIYTRIILVEEQFLLNKFKIRYSKFCNNVPVFFPHIWNFKKSKNTFSLKKILRQEYSSTLSTIISFIYLDLIMQIVYSKKYLGSIHIMDNIYLYSWILVISIYIVLWLKIFKTYTSLLDD